MNVKPRSLLFDGLLLVLFLATLYLVAGTGSFGKMFQLPSSLQHMNTIFLSILIEALPFVLIGVLIAGLIQVFITEDHIKRWIPKNKGMAIAMSCVVGACFPACECGIVPIVRRLVGKGVPIYAGVGFLLTGPLINPMVILSTFMAFGNDIKIAAERLILGFLIAILVSWVISLFFRKNQLKLPIAAEVSHSHDHQPLQKKISHTLTHAVDEFFDVGKYLIVGCLLAAFVQTYISSETLVNLGDGQASSTAVMMGLAYLLSLCSEADAFIAASFSNVFPNAAILGFLIYGPMIDLKNTMMLLSVFKVRFVLILFGVITSVVFTTILIFQNML
ncbi:permease [Sediminibacillus sp. JSM 1682029]|uniref:permease n=1 Tax=Sediminibacillus sp. JSM 1682029 TaxID=3229857 RepID=UPI000421F289